MTKKENLREDLAEYAHVSWSGWMDYLFGKSALGRDGSIMIPPELVTRWKRQAQMPYVELPENEKESDRKEADTMLQIMNGD